MVNIGHTMAISWKLTFAGILAGLVVSGGVYAKAGTDAGFAVQPLQSSIESPLEQEPVTPATANKAVSEDSQSQPQVLASLESSILENGESGSSIDASTVLENSSGLVLNVPETSVEPTEPGEHIVATSTEEVLPARGISYQPLSGTEASVPAVRKDHLPARQQPSTSSEEAGGLPYAIILALFALISLIPVARRNDHHHHV